MTRTDRIFWTTSLILGLIVAACLQGCTAPQQGAYKTLAVVGLTVDKAMQGAAEATALGKVSAEDWAEIATVHGKFIVSYATACDLAGYDYTKFAPEYLLQMQKQLLDTINLILTKP